MGIGIAPNYCGKGWGKELLVDTINKAKEKYFGRKIVLQVRFWNKRAIKCYESVGFKGVNMQTKADYKCEKTKYVFMEYFI